MGMLVQSRRYVINILDCRSPELLQVQCCCFARAHATLSLTRLEQDRDPFHGPA
jgi:hypothetical protein